jgi:restriction system protein
MLYVELSICQNAGAIFSVPAFLRLYSSGDIVAIPDFQSLMLPTLLFAGDEQEHSVEELRVILASEFQLTNDELQMMLPSGRQATFTNRVGWAKSYLTLAKLINNTGRGRFKITARGKEVLNSPPDRIDIRYLYQFSEFAESRGNNRNNAIEPIESELSQTPEELLEASYQRLRTNLAQEMLTRVKQVSPQFFEQLVIDLLLAMGYGGSRRDAGRVVGQSGDDGIDGVINEDKLGLDVVYIQAKRWEGSVGRPVVQAFVGSLAGNQAKKGIFITTSKFTDDAIKYVQRIEQRVILIDGDRLTQLMIDHDIGVAQVARYEVKRIDLGYFEE